MNDTCPPDSINYLFAQVAKAQRARTHELLSELGLHVGQEMILVALSRHSNLTLSQLAENLEVQPPTITKMVQRLERSGIVKREICPRDSRSSSVCLTAKGKTLERKIESIWQTLEKEFFGDLRPEEKKQFRALLVKTRATPSSVRSKTAQPKNKESL
ncbi:MAG: MarR family winged helix-turn-helix transcriptional regulator [Trueperaceae bacterium]